ncbi:uncharacterized protein (TIGR02246 family) [Nocardia transvalensis]|uniref:Uncharacterized protein (TIGR02246 family) n=1 Tax=Nocardia transvalensis TaxID=37333 RepID=A0A7W9PLV6_9NOCA|nr:SgcJ/EcaC family oxidoreductase [Nocardia transvalensis]MBB5918547.1 uncharacterized protein (TIGR02246 family) [Nocardia transvalensis]
MTTTQADLDAIHDVVGTVQHAQRNELVDEFVGLFHPDAIWTTGGGKLLVGRDAIAEFTASVLPGAMRAGTATYEVVLVRFLRPDVAAVKVRQLYFDNAGEVTGEGSPMYVMTRSDGRWLLSACQNTEVPRG